MEEYIFIQGADETGVFVKTSTITSMSFDMVKRSAVITTSDGESYPVFGLLAVNQLHDYFYQYSKLKLFRDKQ